MNCMNITCEISLRWFDLDLVKMSLIFFMHYSPDSLLNLAFLDLVEYLVGDGVACLYCSMPH